MNIKLIVVGNLKDQSLKAMQQEFAKRLQAYAKLEIIEVNEEKSNEEPNESQTKIILNKEGERLLSKVKDSDYLILVDLHGKQVDSIAFSKKIDQIMTYEGSSLAFVIGGSYGLSDELRKKAKFSWCLSNLTFTHQMTRILVLEQIYRAFKILNHEVYHK